jgi:hypothetical protein
VKPEYPASMALLVPEVSRCDSASGGAANISLLPQSKHMVLQFAYDGSPYRAVAIRRTNVRLP